MAKKMFKSDDRIFSGLLGGLADYLDADPSFVRVVYVIVSFLTGLFPGIVAYIIAAAIVPGKNEAIPKP